MPPAVFDVPIKEMENNLFTADPILEIRNLSISLKSDNGQPVKKIVKNVSLVIRPGEMLGLVGESGSGKSLTAAAVLGLLSKSMKTTDGVIFLKGKELTSIEETEMRRLRGKELAFLFQNYQGSFTPFMKIGKQLVETIHAHERIGKKEAKKKALWWLSRVSLPAERIFSSYPFQLSGGQLQRAAIAAALMLRPSLIIADEPTTALDVLTGEKILDLLAELQKEFNTAVLLISHDLKHVLRRSDMLAIMYGGQIVEYGRTGNIRENPENPYTQLLFNARPVLRKETTDRVLPTPGDIRMLEVQNMSKSYKTTKAVNNLSFDIKQGECLGLIGESGSGKSTIAKLLLGLEEIDSGEVVMNGTPLRKLSGRKQREFRRHIQIVFQDPSASLNPKLPIWKSVIEPLENFPETIPSFLKECRKDRRKMAEVLLGIVGLQAEYLDRFPHQLSGGQKQRVAIARGISLQPNLLICDEPTSSLDVSVQAQILDLIKELKTKLNMSFLFISHDMAAVKYMSDRIAVVKEGNLVDLFPSQDLFLEDRHPYTKMLVEAGMEE
jgi:ABC-type glutathione transport system ATPase component